MNTSQNVLQISSAISETSRETAMQLTDSCTDNGMIQLSHSTNSLCFSHAHALSVVALTTQQSDLNPMNSTPDGGW